MLFLSTSEFCNIKFTPFLVFVVSHQVGNDRQNTSKENSVVKLNDTEKWSKNVDKNVLQNIYY